MTVGEFQATRWFTFHSVISCKSFATTVANALKRIPWQTVRLNASFAFSHYQVSQFPDTLIELFSAFNSLVSKIREVWNGCLKCKKLILARLVWHQIKSA